MIMYALASELTGRTQAGVALDLPSLLDRGVFLCRRHRGLDGRLRGSTDLQGFVLHSPAGKEIDSWELALSLGWLGRWLAWCIRHVTFAPWIATLIGFLAVFSVYIQGTSDKVVHRPRSLVLSLVAKAMQSPLAHRVAEQRDFSVSGTMLVAGSRTRFGLIPLRQRQTPVQKATYLLKIIGQDELLVFNEDAVWRRIRPLHQCGDQLWFPLTGRDSIVLTRLAQSNSHHFFLQPTSQELSCTQEQE